MLYLRIFLGHILGGMDPDQLRLELLSYKIGGYPFFVDARPLFLPYSIGSVVVPISCPSLLFPPPLLLTLECVEGEAFQELDGQQQVALHRPCRRCRRRTRLQLRSRRRCSVRGHSLLAQRTGGDQSGSGDGGGRVLRWLSGDVVAQSAGMLGDGFAICMHCIVRGTEKYLFLMKLMWPKTMAKDADQIQIGIHQIMFLANSFYSFGQ